MNIKDLEQGCVFEGRIGPVRQVVAMAGNLMQFTKGPRSKRILQCTVSEFAEWAVADVTEKQVAA